MIAPDIRAVCFDAVGTLIFPDPPAHLVYAAVGGEFGSRLDATLIRAKFRQAFAEEEKHDFENGLHTSEERELRRWRHIVGTVLDDVADVEACFQKLYAHFQRPAAWRCAPGTGEVLNQLAQQFTLALASNYDHRLRPVVAGMPDLRHLSQLIISSEVGWRKPAPAFFSAVCDRLALPPECILYVGDDPSNDYAGARAAGLTAVLIDPDQTYPPDVQRIGDVRELLETTIG